MPKAKPKVRMKQQRLKLDVILMFVAVVAIAGGVIIFQSYAASKINVKHQGQYLLTKLSSQQLNSASDRITKSYSFDPAQGKLYCVNPSNLIDIYARQDQAVVAPTNPGCFEALTNSPMTITITATSSQILNNLSLQVN